MEKEIKIILAEYGLGKEMTMEEAAQRILSLFNGEYINESKLVKCDNCEEMVEMVSTGEMCPCCYC